MTAYTSEISDVLWQGLGISPSAFQQSDAAPRFFSTAEVDRWSAGAIRKPETFNYRTYRPEKGGLFCEEVFGSDSYNEESDLVAALSDSAHTSLDAFFGLSERMGRVETGCSLIHPWFVFKDTQLLSNWLGIPHENVVRISRYEEALVIDSRLMEILEGEWINSEDAFRLSGNDLTVAWGGDAIRQCLEEKGYPASMVSERVWILPSTLRPASGAMAELQEQGVKASVHEINDLYRRMINRNNRLVRLKELNAPVIIIVNEMRMLQESYDTLVENGLNEKIIYGPHKHVIAGLQQMMDELKDENPRVMSEICAALDNFFAAREPNLSLPAEAARWLHLVAAMGITFEKPND
ncbi:MAG: hypothetical protein EP343_03745 [Deltaproteobacteria bacterium]|nr:MAG: hypothetical protein EP343_03745 [Deltaproteobacteria bacterium]